MFKHKTFLSVVWDKKKYWSGSALIITLIFIQKYSSIEIVRYLASEVASTCHLQVFMITKIEPCRKIF